MAHLISLAQEIDRIIEYQLVTTLFQPIIELTTGKILGYEALSRGPVNSPLHKPLDLFKVAREANKLFALEKVCRRQALLNFEQFNNTIDYKLFINVDPQVVTDQNFRSGTTKKLIDQLSLSQENIVIELTEHTPIEDFEAFNLALDNYQGYQLAIDDTGAGHSGLQSLVSIAYNFIKLDRSLIQGIDHNFVKQALLESIVDFATKVNSTLIAEGIEREEELNLLAELGIDYGQGYFIAPPAKGIINN
ncbi:EAL domain-containing protein [Natroniella acetigena]|uniref:EAL domain-containing protein n=1 Tax=Natroniella acetigena TaxID=52004 RepID=UPI00200A905B|nr:EAL domain-containing protein [Natroniella acetigena]MCK8826525.1 EAL domain-containing protein [Natroniella acetigena]